MERFLRQPSVVSGWGATKRLRTALRRATEHLPPTQRFEAAMGGRRVAEAIRRRLVRRWAGEQTLRPRVDPDALMCAIRTAWARQPARSPRDRRARLSFLLTAVMGLRCTEAARLRVRHVHFFDAAGRLLPVDALGAGAQSLELAGFTRKVDESASVLRTRAERLDADLAHVCVVRQTRAYLLLTHGHRSTTADAAAGSDTVSSWASEPLLRKTRASPAGRSAEQSNAPGVSADTVRNDVARVTAAAGITDLTANRRITGGLMRSVAATRLAAAGASLSDVASVLGHASLDSTRRYQRRALPDQATAILTGRRAAPNYGSPHTTTV